MRLKVLAARDEAIQGLLAEARASLAGVSKAPGYQALMAGLIVQGAKKLEANAAVVRCRAVDVDVTRAAIAEVEAKNPGSQAAARHPRAPAAAAGDVQGGRELRGGRPRHLHGREDRVQQLAGRQTEGGVREERPGDSRHHLRRQPQHPGEGVS